MLVHCIYKSARNSSHIHHYVLCYRNYQFQDTTSINPRSSGQPIGTCSYVLHVYIYLTPQEVPVPVIQISMWTLTCSIYLTQLEVLYLLYNSRTTQHPTPPHPHSPLDSPQKHLPAVIYTICYLTAAYFDFVSTCITPGQVQSPMNNDSLIALHAHGPSHVCVGYDV